MAFLGSADATGNGTGPLYFSATADITGMAVAAIASCKIGTTAIDNQTGDVYVLTANAGVRAWVKVN